MFLEFFREPRDSPRWTRPGVYTAQTFGTAERRIQIILLDTRTFRSPLTRSPKNRPRWFGPYQADADPDKTLLGEAQWEWLAERLKEPARLRLIVSSIQVIPIDHGWEKWGNLPHERQRLLDLVRRSGTAPVIVLSGDRHFAEISRLPGRPPIYELTSSAMNTALGGHERERNRFRIGPAVRVNNFGVVKIDWVARSGQAALFVYDASGNERLRQDLNLQVSF